MPTKNNYNLEIEELTETVVGGFLEDFEFETKEDAMAALIQLRKTLGNALSDSLLDNLMFDDD